MKTKIALGLLTILSLTVANAGDKFSNLTKDYLNTKASLDVRKTIAKDPKTSESILKILRNDSNVVVRAFAEDNLK